MSTMQTNPPPPAEQATLLLVDDEKQVIAALGAVFRRQYRVLCTTEPARALEIVRRERVDVIISDQRMPDMLGAELLRQVKKVSPGTMRILLTGYSDLESIMSSINEGEVFRFINKPWSNEDIRDIVASAVRIARNTINAVPVVADASGEDEAGNAASDPRAATRRLVNARVLVIDDEGDLAALCRGLMQTPADCLHAPDIEAALELLASGVDVLVSDIQSGGQDISDFIKLVKHRYPAVPTIVTSRWLDSGVAIDLINEGQVYRYLKRPVPLGMLRLSLLSATRHAAGVRAAPELVQRHEVQDIKQVRNASLFQRLTRRIWPFRRSA